MTDNLQSQNVGKCAELRETCQHAIFDKMDLQHSDQMTALGKIKEDIAYRKGREEHVMEDILSKFVKRNGNGTVPIVNQNFSNNSFKEVAIKILISWGPWILFLLGLGIVTWLKSKGWL